MSCIDGCDAYARLLSPLLTASASTTTGFPSPEEIQAPDIDTQVLPQSATPGFVVRQWVFPSMVFNCSGNVTRWIFRAQETGLDSGEFPRISTWRDSPFTPQTTDFVRVGASGSAEELTGDGPVYEYVLQEPVSVQEGDILGIELPVGFQGNFRDNVEQLDFEFLDMGDGNAPDSFRRSFFGRSVNIAQLASGVNPFGLIRDQQYVPLIAAVIGEYHEFHDHARRAQILICMFACRFSRWQLTIDSLPHLHHPTHTGITNHTPSDR